MSTVVRQVQLARLELRLAVLVEIPPRQLAALFRQQKGGSRRLRNERNRSSVFLERQWLARVQPISVSGGRDPRISMAPGIERSRLPARGYSGRSLAPGLRYTCWARIRD